jgi:DNA-binding NarL/FixJ family response regulator
MNLGRSEYLVLSFPIAATEPFSDLTEAEREVATLVLQGLSNRQIAERRGAALRTVANQVASLLRRLGVRSRYELIARFG